MVPYWTGLSIAMLELKSVDYVSVCDRPVDLVLRPDCETVVSTFECGIRVVVGRVPRKDRELTSELSRIRRPLLCLG